MEALLFTEVVVETTVEEHEDDPTRPEATDPVEAVDTNSRPTSVLVLPVRCPLPRLGMDRNPSHHRHLVLVLITTTIPTAATALNIVVVAEQNVTLLLVSLLKTQLSLSFSSFLLEYHTHGGTYYIIVNE